MDLGGFSLTGPREANEDSYFFQDFSSVGPLPRDIRAFVMVSDGMGGYQGGDVASSLAVQSAQSYLKQLVQLAQDETIDIDPLAAMAEIVQRAHDAIMAVARERGGASMGATFVGAFLSPNHAWIGHVGDSRAYLIRDGRALQLTEDHSQVGRMLSQGVLTEEEAQNHPNRNRIERALGFPNYQIEFDEVDLGLGDALLLCSDGVYTVVNGATLAAYVDEATNASEAAQQVANEAIASETDDNSTTVIAMGFAGGVAANAAVPNRVATLTGAEGVRPVLDRKRVVRTLTEADGIAPVRDGDSMSQDEPYGQRRPARQSAHRQGYAAERHVDGADRSMRGQVRARSSEQRRGNASERSTRRYASQSQFGYTRKLDAQARRRPSRTNRPGASAGGINRSRRGAPAPKSRFTWRTALIIGIVVIAIVIIGLLVVNALTDVKPADDSANIVNVGSSSAQAPEGSDAQSAPNASGEAQAPGIVGDQETGVQGEMLSADPNDIAAHDGADDASNENGFENDDPGMNDVEQFEFAQQVDEGNEA